MTRIIKLSQALMCSWPSGYSTRLKILQGPACLGSSLLVPFLQYNCSLIYIHFNCVSVADPGGWRPRPLPLLKLAKKEKDGCHDALQVLQVIRPPSDKFMDPLLCITHFMNSIRQYFLQQLLFLTFTLGTNSRCVIIYYLN